MKTGVVNERLVFLDISGGGMRVRIASAYFPHSGYADAHIQALYTTLTEIHKDAAANKFQFILAADFNAEVGSRMDTDSSKVIGPNGFNSENQRGQWLKQWAAGEIWSSRTPFSRNQDQAG